MSLSTNTMQQEDLINYIIKERMQVIQRLAHRSMTLRQAPDKFGPEKALYIRLEALLNHLGSSRDVRMTPELKTKSKINIG